MRLPIAEHRAAHRWYTLGTRCPLIIPAAVLCGDPSQRLLEEG
jgi:hypothetical protein